MLAPELGPMPREVDLENLGVLWVRVQAWDPMVPPPAAQVQNEITVS